MYLLHTEIIVGSSPTITTIKKGNIMKTVYFESYRNKEKFECRDLNDVRMIDGIEYLRVFKFGTQRDCLVRKDQLRKLTKNEKPM